MKLMHPFFSCPICFRENRIPVVTIENPAAFRKMVMDLILQSEGGNGEFILSEDDHCLDCADCLHAVWDYAHLSALERRVQTKFLSQVTHVAQEIMAADIVKLRQTIQEFLGKLSISVDFPVCFEQSENLSALLKAMDFRVDLEGLPLNEALYEHLSMHKKLLKNQCFVLIHAKSYFATEELMQLYRMAQYEKWNLLLIESDVRYEHLPQEDHRLLDGDLCELVLENGGE